MNEQFNIVIVEDKRVVGKIIESQLLQKGYGTHRFENAEDAYSFLQQNYIYLQDFAP